MSQGQVSLVGRVSRELPDHWGSQESPEELEPQDQQVQESPVLLESQETQDPKEQPASRVSPEQESPVLLESLEIRVLKEPPESQEIQVP